ncbi:DNA polymerase III subunit delta [Candidatus Pelagibacter sp. HIMB1623]|uniref:DNA polymerase III subunit delta n=1 Tax=Candidatus Pelagibacter sp. HIMB1623 TaxID=3413358 RepID=UPI003F845350
MIIKSYETKNIDFNYSPFILLYGANEGLKQNELKNILKEKKLTSSYDEKDILNNPNSFFESLLSTSLFENERVILIKRATDKLYLILSELFNKELSDIIIILDSDMLDKKSKLRSFFEKAKNCICIPFYPDNEETLSKIGYEFIKKRKINISISNINLIASKCNGDRKFFLSELEKLENYSRNGKKIDNETIFKLTNLIENHSIFELVDSCLAHNKRKTLKILNENNFNNEDSIIIMRSFLIKSKTILRLLKEFEKNQNLNLTISSAKPPIFWKEKEITKQQILNWTPRALKETLYKITEVELKIKKNYENSTNLVSDFILNLVSKKVSN